MAEACGLRLSTAFFHCDTAITETKLVTIDVSFCSFVFQHLLAPEQYCPATSSLNFVRGVQEKTVADTLSRSRRPAESVSTTYARLHENDEEANESQEFVKSKTQLEAELAELENIVVHYHLKKAQITEFMATESEETNANLPTINEEGKDVRLRFRRGASTSSNEAENGDRPHDPRR